MFRKPKQMADYMQDLKYQNTCGSLIELSVEIHFLYKPSEAKL